MPVAGHDRRADAAVRAWRTTVDARVAPPRARLRPCRRGSRRRRPRSRRTDRRHRRKDAPDARRLVPRGDHDDDARTGAHGPALYTSASADDAPRHARGTACAGGRFSSSPRSSRRSLGRPPRDQSAPLPSGHHAAGRLPAHRPGGRGAPGERRVSVSRDRGAVGLLHDPRCAQEGVRPRARELPAGPAEGACSTLGETRRARPTAPTCSRSWPRAAAGWPARARPLGRGSVDIQGERATVVTGRGTRYPFRRRENGIWGLTLFTAELAAEAERASRDLEVVERGGERLRARARHRALSRAIVPATWALPRVGPGPAGGSAVLPGQAGPRPARLDHLAERRRAPVPAGALVDHVREARREQACAARSAPRARLAADDELGVGRERGASWTRRVRSAGPARWVRSPRRPGGPPRTPGRCGRRRTSSPRRASLASTGDTRGMSVMAR